MKGFFLGVARLAIKKPEDNCLPGTGMAEKLRPICRQIE
jgi:hypothetical protein